jgi:hypothetical protein
MTFSSPSGDAASVSVRYSNDNTGASETVKAVFDGEEVGSFVAQDTGDWGEGWNVFVWSAPMSAGSLVSGDHSVTITVADGDDDGHGIEIDAVTVDYFGAKHCLYLPVVLGP